MFFMAGKHGRFTLCVRVLAVVGLVLALKLAAHWYGWEILSANPLFSGIIAANVFLMGFLLSGVLGDYKESERLPGELACSLEAIADEARSVYKTKQALGARKCFEHLLDLTLSIKEWFHKKQRTRDVMTRLDGLDEFFVAFESLTQANFIVRLKQEQSNVRRTLVRIHTIRETSFMSSGQMATKTTNLLLIGGLILSKIDPFYESLFFVGVITFLLAFLNLLIRDLDNPFGYYDEHSIEDVSLKPLDDLVAHLKSLAGEPPQTAEAMPVTPQTRAGSSAASPPRQMIDSMLAALALWR
jgi:predicted membrane chloride channel (bestrophin family)